MDSSSASPIKILYIESQRAGQLILARDAMYEDRYWPCFVARYNDLPIAIRNGLSSPEAKDFAFPYTIKASLIWFGVNFADNVKKELISCKSDYIPVMVPASKAFGWVPTIFCTEFDEAAALQEYKESLKAPEEMTDVAFRRALKGTLLLESEEAS